MNIEDLAVMVRFKKVRFWACAYAYLFYCWALGKEVQDATVQKIINRFVIVKWGSCQ